MEAASIKEPRKRKRQQILVSCNLCRQRHVKCDGSRPVCTPCQSRSITECVFDTQTDGETRHASLKRENKTLQDRLTALDRSVKHICEMPDDEAMSFLKRIRETADPLSTLTSLSMGTPATSLEQQAARAVLPPVQTKLEHELMVTNSAIYQVIEPIDISSLVNEVPGDPFSLKPLSDLRKLAR